MNLRSYATCLVYMICVGREAVAQSDDARFGLADLSAYRAALESPGPRAEPAVPAGFSEVWTYPERYQGRRVRVEGRLARLFNAPAVGSFPDLVEAWLMTPADNPFCLVFPKSGSNPSLGTTVSFEGTFLRLVSYQAGDEARLAPLVVGPQPPIRVANVFEAATSGFSTIDWVVAGGLGAAVLLWFAARHVSRPRPRPRQIEPPPEFEA